MLLTAMWYIRVEKTRPDWRTSYLWVWQGLHTPGLKWLSTFLCLFVLHCPWSLGGGICHRCLWIWEYWLWFQSGKSPTLSYSIPEIPRKGEKVYMYIHTNIYIHTHTDLLCIYYTYRLIYWYMYTYTYIYVYMQKRVTPSQLLVIGTLPHLPIISVLLKSHCAGALHWKEHSPDSEPQSTHLQLGRQRHSPSCCLSS